jgi:hypothetical protein
MFLNRNFKHVHLPVLPEAKKKLPVIRKLLCYSTIFT